MEWILLFFFCLIALVLTVITALVLTCVIYVTVALPIMAIINAWMWLCGEREGK